MYLGMIAVPSAAVPPSRYVVTACGERFQRGGRGQCGVHVGAEAEQGQQIAEVEMLGRGGDDVRGLGLHDAFHVGAQFQRCAVGEYAYELFGGPLVTVALVRGGPIAGLVDDLLAAVLDEGRQNRAGPVERPPIVAVPHGEVVELITDDLGGGESPDSGRELLRCELQSFLVMLLELPFDTEGLLAHLLGRVLSQARDERQVGLGAIAGDQPEQAQLDGGGQRRPGRC